MSNVITPQLPLEFSEIINQLSASFVENPNPLAEGVFNPQIEDSEFGYASVTSLKNLVSQNLKNLLLTDPGERIMDVNFGVGIKRYLFENKSPIILQSLRSRINSQINTYMPFLVINDVILNNNIEIDSPEDEPNFLGIKIFYTVPSSNISDVLTISYDYLTG